MNLTSIKERIISASERINQFLEKKHVRITSAIFGALLVIISTSPIVFDVLIFDVYLLVVHRLVSSIGIGLLGIALNMDGIKGKIANVGVAAFVWIVGIFSTADVILFFGILALDINQIISGAGAFLIGINIRSRGPITNLRTD